MQRLIHLIDALNEGIGRSVAWLVLGMMIVTGVVVVLRYGFSIGSIALQESVMYLHGVVFMLGIPYALKHDAHVRVDVIYGRLSPRRKDVINLLGHLLFLLKTLIPVLGGLLCLQGGAEIARIALRLLGRAPATAPEDRATV